MSWTAAILWENLLDTAGNLEIGIAPLFPGSSVSNIWKALSESHILSSVSALSISAKCWLPSTCIQPGWWITTVGSVVSIQKWNHQHEKPIHFHRHWSLCVLQRLAANGAECPCVPSKALPQPSSCRNYCQFLLYIIPSRAKGHRDGVRGPQRMGSDLRADSSHEYMLPSFTEAFGSLYIAFSKINDISCVSQLLSENLEKEGCTLLTINRN